MIFGRCGCYLYVNTKSSGHTQGGTELDVKPWSKVHGSRSGPMSRPFTERCEKGAGCVSKVQVSHHVRKTAHDKARSKLVVTGWT